jgi:hypothetical protein
VDLLIKGVSEGIAEIGLDRLTDTLFGKPMEGFMSGTGREMITDMMHGLMESFRGQIQEYVCSMDFGKLAGGLGDMFKGGATGAVEGGKPGAGSAIDAIKGAISGTPAEIATAAMPAE